ncbi:MAG TPA: iron ABC transporter substrate-binding protein, partial [Clostridium sp.]|nr:iron ABC transporter substrate-binding protein [Clostridium sp.]
MRKFKIFKLTAIMAICALMLTACTNSNNEAGGPETKKPVESTVEITDVHGTVTVPVNPKNVVALDNRTFETLADW